MNKPSDKMGVIRYALRKSGCFAFTKGGMYFLYREVQPKNQLVLKSSSLDDFYRRVPEAAGVKLP